MNNTNQERYFRYFIIALTAAVLLFVVLPAKADTCERADRYYSMSRSLSARSVKILSRRSVASCQTPALS